MWRQAATSASCVASSAAGFVVEDQPGDDQEPADRDARQLTERVVIAAHRPLHEIPLHRASACARPIWSRYSL